MNTQSICRFAVLFGVLSLFGALFAAPSSAEREKSEKSRYIVFFKDSVKAPASLARTQTENRDAKLGFVYRLSFKGYSAELTKAQVQGLREDARVDFIAPDREVEAFAQSVPTGIDRVFATANTMLAIDEEDNLRVDADIAILDTGTDHNHPDLDVVARTDCSKGTESEASCDDEAGTDSSGHGTHVAGTAAAIDNDYGVVGVAPGARIWGVKVLGSGTNYDSEIAAGVEWVTARADDIEVANMSLGCGCSLPATAKAIESSAEAGIVYVVAAGNGESNASSVVPANHPDVITVSAVMDLDGKPGEGKDPLAWFSNYGSVVDIAAPGVAIWSTFPGNEYESNSGTSMASPHVAGAAAILAAQDKPESKADVEAIRDTIVEEGNFDWKDTSGDGIQEPLLDVSNEAVFLIPPKPKATTRAATAVMADSATLNATVNPEGLATTYQFEYGTDVEYGSVIPASPKAIGSGTAEVEVDESIEGLEDGTTYHFRVVADDEAGTTYGQDLKFTTLPKPQAMTEPATQVGGRGATLNATVNPKGFATTYQFEYGTTTEYGSKAPASPQYAGSDSSSVEVSTKITGLKPRLAYHYRVVATNSQGTTYGANKSFTTSPSGFLADEYPVTVKGAPEGGSLMALGGSWYCLSPAVEWAMHAPSEALATGEAPSCWHAGPVSFEMNGCELFFQPGNGGTEGSFGGTLEIGPPNCGPIEVELAADCSIEIDPQGDSTAEAVYANQGEGSEAFVEVNASLSGLEHTRSGSACGNGSFKNGAWYDLRWELRAENEEEESVGLRVSGEFPRVPAVETKPASEVSAHEALLNGTINPEGALTHYHFEYGTSTAYGTKVPVPSGQIGEEEELWGGGGLLDDVDVDELIEGLLSGQTYHYRLVAVNEDEVTVYGEDQTFTTVDLRPSVATDPATGVGGDAATLNATVNPNGLATTYQFEYGTDTEYGSKVPASPKAIGAGEEGIEVDELLEGLDEDTTYHFRVTATNEEGTVYGEDRTFTTVDLRPVAITEAASYVFTSGANLNATVNPNGLETTYQLEYGLTTEYGAYEPASPSSIGSGTEDVEIALGVGGLEENAVYHYRVVATNSQGTTYGANKSFTTSPSGFLADEYPVTVKGAPEGGSLMALGGSWYCLSPGLEMVLNAPSEAIATGEAPSCWHAGPVSFEMNGCELFFQPGNGFESTFGGTLEIGPPNCGPIEVELAADCSIEIDPQGDSTAEAVYANQGEGSEAFVEVHASLSGLEHTRSGSACGNGSFKNGAWYDLRWELRAENEEAEPVGLRVVANEPEEA